MIKIIGIIVASHGNFSREIIRSAELIVGTIPNCESITLNMEDNVDEVSKEIREDINKLEEGQGVIVMVDIFGGTPSNLSLLHARGKHVQVLSGLNLPMLIEFALSRNKYSVEELAERCIEESMVSVKNITNIKKQKKEEEGK